MKTLLTLSLLQTAAILFLLFTAAADRGASPPHADVPSPVEWASTSEPLPPPAPGAYPSEERLRQIVREELEARLTAASGTGALPRAVPAARDEAQDRRQRESIDQRIEYFKSTGSISDEQMQALHRDIARLDPASRKEMLGKLTRALNAREIDGRM